jgi:protoheme IX farnesyltransferase
MKSTAVAFPIVRTRSRAGDFVALTKPRLNFLVIVTTLMGYYVGADHDGQTWVLLATIVGTALVAGGSAALNQVFERDIDGLMQRTRMRPLPTGRIQPGEATVFGAALSLIGLVVLAVGAGWLPMGVAAATLVTYAFVYTPLKRRTALATVLGAVPGALPPVIGWAAARGDLSLPAWALFAIVFFWQMPHFLAIAWLYRDDYARAGIPLLPVVDPDGHSTGRQALAYTGALIPISILPAAVGLGGTLFLVSALVLGVGFLACALLFATRLDRPTARLLFFGSITYLPLLWVALAVDRLAG